LEEELKKKLIAGLVAGLASVALVATPSFAAVDDPGVLVTVNPSGGVGLDDGLKLDIAFGQIQIGRNGSGQLYDDVDVPDPTDPELMSNYFTVALSDGTNISFVGSRDPIESGTGAVNAWDSFTSEATLTDGDKSGVVVNHLKYGTGSSEVLLDVTWTYTYPNQWFNVSANLTLGSDYTGQQHKVYWYTDSYLEGSDEGNQFGGLTPAGQEVAGVVSMAGTQIEAFRQVAGQSLKWFAGEYECPYTEPSGNDEPGTSTNIEECGTASGTDGWMSSFSDFPSVVAPATYIDNGFGVSTASSTALTDTFTFDLLFASCVDGVAALPCADSATGIEATLPDTGSDQSAVIGFGAAAIALLAVGGALVIARRRRA
jgi:LPXTG-motif cell wall-anchored protein